MVKKLRINTIVIVGLILVLCISLVTLFYKNRYVEGANNYNADDFSVALNVKLNGKLGRIVPFPTGSFNILTSSGKTNKSVDFDMNEIVNIKTTYNTDSTGNILDRNIAIKPKSTGTSRNINIGDVIPNRFSLDISFNQTAYKLNSIADLKAQNELEQATDPSKKVSLYNLNVLDNNQNLIITGMGTIYDTNNNKIGTVSMNGSDINNDKSFNIKVDIPTDPKNLLKSYINIIKITFIYPKPIASKTGMPVPPPPIPQSIVNSIPAPSKDYASNKR